MTPQFPKPAGDVGGAGQGVPGAWCVGGGWRESAALSLVPKESSSTKASLKGSSFELDEVVVEALVKAQSSAVHARYLALEDKLTLPDPPRLARALSP